MLDYKVVSLVENKLGEVQDQRERDAMIDVYKRQLQSRKSGGEKQRSLLVT